MKTFKAMSYSAKGSDHVLRQITPDGIPWDIIEKYEARALENHGQSLEKLTGRGGCDCLELWHIINDEPYLHINSKCPYKTNEEAHVWLKEFISSSQI